MPSTPWTPGPWKVGTRERGRFVVYAGGNGHGRAVCVMSNTQKDSPEHPLNLTADANARLIALAPELVGALEWALANVRCNARGLQGAEEWAGKYNDARALLARLHGDGSAA